MYKLNEPIKVTWAHKACSPKEIVTQAIDMSVLDPNSECKAFRLLPQSRSGLRFSMTIIKKARCRLQSESYSYTAD